MKNFLFAVILLIFIAQIPSFAQIDPQRLLCLRKIESYKRMRNTGITLGVIGVTAFVVGVVKISSADTYQQTQPNGTTVYYFDKNGETGLYCILAGIPLTAVGTVFGIIGMRKVRSYSRKLDGLSFNFKYTQYQKGILVAYRF